MFCHSERSEESVSVCIIELCLHKQILHFVQNDRDGIIYNQVFRTDLFFALSPLGGSWRGLSFQHLLTCFTPFTVRIFLMSCSSFEVSSTITVRVPEKSPS